jgi:hypothetical protein
MVMSNIDPRPFIRGLNRKSGKPLIRPERLYRSFRKRLECKLQLVFGAEREDKLKLAL